MFFEFMDFPETLCLTGGLSSCPGFGRSFVLCWTPRSALHLVITRNPMDRLNDLTRNWRQDYGAWWHRTLQLGANTLFGWSMHTTHFLAPPLVSLHSSVPMVINRHCSLLWRRSPVCPPLRLSSVAVARFGMGLVRCCCAVLRVTRGWLIVEERRLRYTRLAKRCGSPLETYL